jgi:hypothetical protein
LSAPTISVALASLKVVLPEHRKPRSRGDRRDVALDNIAACVKALDAIDKGDARHQEAHVLRNTLEGTSTEAEECEFQ